MQFNELCSRTSGSFAVSGFGRHTHQGSDLVASGAGAVADHLAGRATELGLRAASKKQ